MYSLNEALDLFPNQNEEIFIIGGAELYKQTMPVADKLYITHIDAEDKDADAFFPEITLAEWDVLARDQHESDARHAFSFEFVNYRRKHD